LAATAETARETSHWTGSRTDAAQFFSSVLDAAGIESFIPDQYTSGVQPFYAPALGGVRVLVHAADLERARELLTSAAKPPGDRDQES